MKPTRPSAPIPGVAPEMKMRFTFFVDALRHVPTSLAGESFVVTILKGDKPLTSSPPALVLPGGSGQQQTELTTGINFV